MPDRYGPTHDGNNRPTLQLKCHNEEASANLLMVARAKGLNHLSRDKHILSYWGSQLHVETLAGLAKEYATTEQINRFRGKENDNG